MRIFTTVCLVAMLQAAPTMADPVAGAAQALNAFRAENGRKALSISPKLQATAEGHANDMLSNGFFDHKGSNGSTIGKRAKRKGYRFCLIAENIAKGQRSLADVMQSWETSAGHRKNMLLGKVREFGLARVDQNIWVMVLGKPGC